MDSNDDLYANLNNYWKPKKIIPEVWKVYHNAYQTNIEWRKEILNYNSIEIIHDSQFLTSDLYMDVAEINPKKNMSRSFSLNHMNLHHLPEKLSTPLSVDRLDLSYNQLENIPDIWWDNYFRDLEVIRLQHNKIKSIEWDNLVKSPKLKILDLRNNPIDELWLNKLYNLKRLTSWHDLQILV